MPKGLRGFQKGHKINQKRHQNGEIFGFQKGNKITLGYRHTIEAKRKIGDAMRGDKNPAKRQEVREKIRQTLLNHPVSKETKRKIKELSKGKHYSPKTEFKKGHQVSELIKRKISEAFQGDKHWNWQGGITYLPYSTDWTITLKKSIRERDHYICQLCLKDGYPVHHIDYNKKNCNPANLITLCNVCNSRVNFNRNYWIKYFKV